MFNSWTFQYSNQSPNLKYLGKWTNDQSWWGWITGLPLLTTSYQTLSYAQSDRIDGWIYLSGMLILYELSYKLWIYVEIQMPFLQFFKAKSNIEPYVYLLILCEMFNYLVHGKFTGSLPSGIGNCTNLKDILFPLNKFTGMNLTVHIELKYDFAYSTFTGSDLKWYCMLCLNWI